ncbi:hypothetical protein [Thiosocius teredinicola]|uniref:hypothetical protein n=1 Tax=Thiosocius teredinicola TaxID=1973002 RepID=UPI00157DB29C
MALFRACLGKTACVEDDDHCRTCGRQLDEVYATRELIEKLAHFAIAHDYVNYDEFVAYVARKANAKIRYAVDQANGQATGPAAREQAHG